MADDFSGRTLFFKGRELGELLLHGQADQAKVEYDALISRIHNESAHAPATSDLTSNRVEVLNLGMADQNTDDVKSPGNGTDTGFYIYWNTENLVNKTFSALDNFCQTTKRCDASSDLLNDPVATKGGDSRPQLSLTPSDQGFEKQLNETNEWLAKAMPDQLEHYTFVADFNRRKKSIDWQATIDPDTKAVKIIEQE